MSATDKPDSRTRTADRFSIADMMSFSALPLVAQTFTHADLIFGAVIVTFFDVFDDVMIFFLF
jgi:hypothetical protein